MLQRKELFRCTDYKVQLNLVNEKEKNIPTAPISGNGGDEGRTNIPIKVKQQSY